MEKELLSPGFYYHVYNRGNNKERIFYEPENYRYFLNLYHKYVFPIAKTYAWCLMQNHFHFLIYLKEPEEIDTSELRYQTVEKSKKISAPLQFSHFLNAYAQSINKRYSRSGSLFEKNLKRKKIESEDYFKKLIFYIHNNPQHHGIVKDLKDYPWSSYKSIISLNNSKICRDEVIELFDGIENFKSYHHKEQNLEDLEGMTLE